MNISIISAVAKNGVIGVKNSLPWKLSGDMKYFSKTTTGKTVIMGKNTFLSIFKALEKPLPNRRNIILSKTMEKTKGIEVIRDIKEIENLNNKDEEIFIIGGASLYEQMILLANKMYITEVDCDCEGDTFFPSFNKDEWNIISEEKHTKDEKNEYNYNFKIYERKQK